MTTTLEAIADQVKAGQYEEARQALQSTEETAENRADLLFLKGHVQELEYDRDGALATYDEVLEANPDHAEAIFHAALLWDQGGDEKSAIELYERLLSEEKVHKNALINLAVLYEERGRLKEAETCLTSVLAEDPEHYRALQFLKSVRSSYTMVYDEKVQGERERRSAVLDQLITDFELSVRSRNCLRQMNIRTLRDLLRITEAELLSYKNFGETSLNEIKTLLQQTGLRLGQNLQPAEVPDVPSVPVESDDTTVLRQKPVSDLELSVRSRKCLQVLGIATIGELADRSEAELMSSKNFGQTSLNEIERQLSQFGLSLRT